MRRVALVIALFVLSSALAAPVAAEPVYVRVPETSTQAFPVLSSEIGEQLAAGEFIQTARDDRVETSLTFRFANGSLHEERAVYAQRGVLTLLRYRIAQFGPSFPENIEASIDRETGHYTVRYRTEPDGAWSKASGRFAMPLDVYNGMVPTLLKQLVPGARETVQIVVFTPRPRLITVRIAPVRDEQVVSGGRLRIALRYELRPDPGLFASLFVTDIKPAAAWVAGSDVPEFVKFQGQLYVTGPVWRIETPPRD